MTLTHASTSSSPVAPSAISNTGPRSPTREVTSGRNVHSRPSALGTVLASSFIPALPTNRSCSIVAPGFKRTMTFCTCATSCGAMRPLNQKSTPCGMSTSGDATPMTLMLTGISAMRMALPTMSGSRPKRRCQAASEMTRRNGASRPAGMCSSRVNERPRVIGRPSTSKNPSLTPLQHDAHRGPIVTNQRRIERSGEIAGDAIDVRRQARHHLDLGGGDQAGRDPTVHQTGADGDQLV